MKTIETLDVYVLAEKLSDMVWEEYDVWPKKAQLTVGLQIIRSSDSVAANLAEGYGRYTGPDKKRFYRISRGSFEETKSWLRKAIRRKLIAEDRATEYAEVMNELGPKLNGFINSTK